MRIIAGSAGGRRFKAPAGTATTRPTSDRVRESLFSILGDASALRVLDLFAGSGSLGLESISRGASEVVFCDQDHLALNTLKANLNELNMADNAEVVRSGAEALLGRFAKSARQFDWIFIDPPYASDLAKQCLFLLAESKILSDGGKVIVEHDRRHAPEEIIGCLQRTDTRRYGDTCVSIFERGKIEP